MEQLARRLTVAPGSSFAPFTLTPRWSSVRRASDMELHRPVRTSSAAGPASSSTPAIRWSAPPGPPSPMPRATRSSGSPPNRMSAASAASAAAAGPCTSAVSSSASARWATRVCGRRGLLDEHRLDLGERPERRASAGSVPTTSSSTCTQNWRNWYGRGALRVEPHGAADRLAELRPVALEHQAGACMANTCLPSRRRMRSMPAMMLPHWSLAPTCSSTPCAS